MSRHLQRRVGIIIGRWGGWPGWTPLLLRMMGTNTQFDFLLISDSSPPTSGIPLPPNVCFCYLPLPEMQASVGLQLRLSVNLTLRRQGDVSAAKTNDLKPMWGEALSDLLQGYEWWGYMQEDLLIGNLSTCIDEARLDDADIICPNRPPNNSSGSFMLFRNVPYINRLWRLSQDAAQVLADPRYLVFDEWWGSSTDNLAGVIGREAAAGRVRLSLARAGWPMFWNHDSEAFEDFAACWQYDGEQAMLHVVFGLPLHERGATCLRPGKESNFRDEVCLFHFIKV